MKLFTYWRSSSAYRVRIALGVKGLAYEPRFLHLLRAGGEQHTEEFRAINPIGQIPVLEVDGEPGEPPEFLAQSLAILEYLEERYPAPPLLPKDLVLRARVRELSLLICSGIQPFHNTGTTNALGELAPELEPVRFHRYFIERGLRALELRANELSGRFLVGDQLSFADVLLVPQLYAARRFQVAVDPFPTLLRIEAECSNVPGFAEAHPDRQLDRE